MTDIDPFFTKSPAQLFHDAARAHAWVSQKHQEALAAIEPLRLAVDNAKGNLDWIAAHPGNAEADLQALYTAAVESLKTDPLDAGEKTAHSDGTENAATEGTPEPPKTRRKRRTKAEIEADKAAKEAAEAHETGIEEAAARALPYPKEPAEETFTDTPEGPTAEPEDDTFSEVPTEAVQPSAIFQPPAQSIGQAEGFLNPFAR